MTTNNILIYILIINLITFTSFGIDKYKAIKNQRRIPEKNLHNYSFIGGVIGGVLGMLVFRHKINKLKFVFIQVSIFLFWLVVFIFYNLNYQKSF